MVYKLAQGNDQLGPANGHLETSYYLKTKLSSGALSSLWYPKQWGNWKIVVYVSFNELKPHALLWMTVIMSLYYEISYFKINLYFPSVLFICSSDLIKPHKAHNIYSVCNNQIIYYRKVILLVFISRVSDSTNRAWFVVLNKDQACIVCEQIPECPVI